MVKVEKEKPGLQPAFWLIVLELLNRLAHQR
jgi:hypothetical protein